MNVKENMNFVGLFFFGINLENALLFFSILTHYYNQEVMKNDLANGQKQRKKKIKKNV